MTAQMPTGDQIGLVSYQKLIKVVPDSIAIVNANDHQTIDMYQKANVEIKLCATSEMGMSQSLIHGIKSCEKCDGWIVCLGDMPFVKEHTIRLVLNALHQQALIAVPQYKSTNGHPVGISAKLEPELLNLKGDTGAKTILNRHVDSTVFIPTHDSGVLEDIDTQLQLQQLKKNHNLP